MKTPKPSPLTPSGTMGEESPSAQEHLLRIKDVAARCQVSLRTVQGWVSSDKLQVLRLPGRTVRVTPSALDEFLRRAARPTP